MLSRSSPGPWLSSFISWNGEKRFDSLSAGCLELLHCDTLHRLWGVQQAKEGLKQILRAACKMCRRSKHLRTGDDEPFSLSLHRAVSGSLSCVAFVWQWLEKCRGKILSLCNVCVAFRNRVFHIQGNRCNSHCHRTSKTPGRRSSHARTCRLKSWGLGGSFLLRDIVFPCTCARCVGRYSSPGIQRR